MRKTNCVVCNCLLPNNEKQYTERGNFCDECCKIASRVASKKLSEETAKELIERRIDYVKSVGLDNKYE